MHQEGPVFRMQKFFLWFFESMTYRTNMTINPKIRNAASVLFGVAVVLLMFALPGVLFAQSTGGSGFPFTVPADDLSKTQIIDVLFGPLSGGNAANNPLGGIAGAFSGAVLLVGGVIVGYTLFAGTLATAHEGEVLGRRWSSVWVPVRVALGAAVLLPVPALGGYCALQYVVIWLALQGVGIADMLWDKYLENPVTSSGVMSTDMSAPLTNVASAMLRGNLCVLGQQKAVQIEEAKSGSGAKNISSTGSGDFSLSGPQTTDSSGFIGNGATSGANNSGKLSLLTFNYSTKGAPTCGNIVFTQHSYGTDDLVFEGDQSASSIGKLFAAANRVGSDVSSVHRSHLTAMDAAIRNAVQQVVDNYDDASGTNKSAAMAAAQANLLNVMSTQVASYQKDLQTTATSSYTNATQSYQPMADLQKGGWMMAGAYYVYITRVVSAISDAVTNIPKVEEPHSPVKDHYISSGTSSVAGLTAYTNPAYQYYTYAMNIQTVTDSSVNQMQVASGMTQAQIKSATGKDIGEDSNAISERVLAFFQLAGLNTGLAQASAGAGYVNPVVLVQQIGHLMVAAAWYILGLAGVVGIFSSVLGNLGLALFGALIVPGATFAFYIPMLPFILWIGAVVGWIVLLVEAVIAAPLWAVSHLAPDGDGIVGRAGQGYMLVLSLTLKPGLMIFGLVVALSLMEPIGRLLNMTFLSAFNIVTSDNYGNPSTGVVGLTATLSGMFIYVSLMVSLVRRVFDLIHIIPDTVLRWLGAPGGSELGQGAQAASQSERGVLAGMGAIKLTSDAANTISSGLNRDRQKMAEGKRNAIASKNRQIQEVREGARDARKTDESQANTANLSQDPRRMEAAERSLMNSNMGEAMNWGMGSDGKGNKVFNPSGVKELNEIPTPLGGKNFAEKRSRLDNAFAAARASGNPAQIAATKANLDAFDNTAMDKMKAFTAAHGDGSLSTSDRRVSEAAQSRDAMFGARSMIHASARDANLNAAQTSLSRAASADPGLAASAARSGGVESLMAVAAAKSPDQRSEAETHLAAAAQSLTAARADDSKAQAAEAQQYEGNYPSNLTLSLPETPVSDDENDPNG